MPFPIDEKLVIAIASSALFDLTESDRVYKKQGVDVYRKHQRENENVVLAPGVAFPLIRRFLSLNDGLSEPQRPVEVVLLSRNDPDTGLRVFNSIEHYGLDISRASFVNGGNPFRYMRAFNASLFLSANVADVKEAVTRGLPAGRVFPTDFADSAHDPGLRMAFDFDGILADDASEIVFKTAGLRAFQTNEQRLAGQPHRHGPLARFFREIARLQKFELRRQREDRSYVPRLRTAIATARNAPAHKRVVTTLRDWGISVDEVFFLGGIEKRRILEEFRPHIFFDDQLQHIEGVAGVAPSVHVPFGIANAPSPTLIRQAFAENRRRSKQASRLARKKASRQERNSRRRPRRGKK